MLVSIANDNRDASQITSTDVDDGRTSTEENKTSSGRSEEPFLTASASNEHSEILREQSDLTEDVIRSSNQKSSPENRSKKKKKKKASKEREMAGTVTEGEVEKQKGKDGTSFFLEGI